MLSILRTIFCVLIGSLLFFACNENTEGPSFTSFSSTDDLSSNAEKDTNDEDGDGYVKDYDCDDKHSEKYHKIYFDNDGDGYPGRENSSACVGEPLPDNAILESTFTKDGALWDCNDSDTNGYAIACPDKDSDGICACEENDPWICTTLPWPQGYFYATQLSNENCDCNDEDATLNIPLYTDHDGDRYIAASPSLCIGSTDLESLPEGFTEQPGNDCNDTDVLIAPLRPDIIGNGIDENCDGIDGFCHCADKPRTCDWEVDPIFLDAAPTCQGVDLSMLGALGVGCLGDLCMYFSFSNTGDTVYAGDIRLSSDVTNSRWSCNPKDPVTFFIDISPGQVVIMDTFDHCGILHIETLDATDCNPDNNQTLLEEHGIGCE